MRILFLWPDKLRRDLGGPKIIVEVAEAMQQLGWETFLFDPWTLPDGQSAEVNWRTRCRSYLQAHAQEYDVVDYDHGHLPFPRNDFAPKTLMVARSGLLSHHFVKIAIPDLNPWRDGLRRLIKGPGAHERHEENLRLAQKTCTEADLVNVPNYDDQRELVAHGIPLEKIHVFPFGINEERRVLFRRVSFQLPAQPRIAFVGAFDARKGATDFPSIVSSLRNLLPGVQFRLLGTRGRLRARAEVLRYFPRSLHDCLEIIPEYAPNELPQWLADCSIGLFPSYVEGFPFGVLEMLSAALPVFAYQAPGAPMMLQAEYLVALGDTRGMALKIVALLQDPKRLLAAREQAQHLSEKFSWKTTAELTDQIYRQACDRLRVLR